jgi:hypothetical protein
MNRRHIETLIELRSAFEREEDWVAVGHVVYLLERLSDLDESSDRRILGKAVSWSIH